MAEIKVSYFKKFTATLKDLWNTPAYDMSDVASNTITVEMMQKCLETSNQMYFEEMAKALNDTKMFKAMVVDGIVVATDSEERIRLMSQKYEAKENNGTLILRQKEDEGKLKDIRDHLFDKSDRVEYESRYVSLDMKHYPEDGSTISFIRILGPKDETGNRKVVFPVDMNAPGVSNNKFKQFILMQMGVQAQERMQVVETNEHYQVLFFGKRPEQLQLSGILKHTIDNPWNTNMLFAWDEYMRGTKLVENGNICQLFIDDVLYEGYPFNFSRSKNASADYMVSFSMGFLVKERISIVS